MKRPPRINSPLTIDVHVGAGTHRVASYNHWVALRRMLDGKTVAVAALRGSEEIPPAKTHCACTREAAWFAFAEKRARLARSGEARGPRGAVEGLLQGAGGRDREIEAVITVV